MEIAHYGLRAPWSAMRIYAQLMVQARSPRGRLVRVSTLATRFVRHPVWAASHVRNALESRQDRRHLSPSPELGLEAVSVVAALRRMTSADDIAIEECIARAPRPRSDRGSVLYGHPDASRELVSFAYAFCRLTRPEAVAETGVANGFTAAAILSALAENGSGRLLSVDLPQLHPRAERAVGGAVPEALRSRWTLALGPSRRVLPRVLAEARALGLFVQDGSHSTAGQLYDYRTAWPYLAPGGLLVTDDVGPAFSLFAVEAGAEGLLVPQDDPRKSGPLGVLRKPLGP